MSMSTAPAAPAIGISLSINLGDQHSVVVQTHVARDASPEEKAEVVDVVHQTARRFARRHKIVELQDELLKLQKHIIDKHALFKRAEFEYEYEKSQRAKRVLQIESEMEREAASFEGRGEFDSKRFATRIAAIRSEQENEDNNRHKMLAKEQVQIEEVTAEITRIEAQLAQVRQEFPDAPVI